MTPRRRASVFAWLVAALLAPLAACNPIEAVENEFFTFDRAAPPPEPPDPPQ